MKEKTIYRILYTQTDTSGNKYVVRELYVSKIKASIRILVLNHQKNISKISIDKGIF